MITLEQLASLEPDDLIETSPLFAGVTKEKIVLRVREVKDEQIKCAIVWFGITLGTLQGRVKKDKLVWEMK